MFLPTARTQIPSLFHIFSIMTNTVAAISIIYIVINQIDVIVKLYNIRSVVSIGDSVIIIIRTYILWIHSVVLHRKYRHEPIAFEK